MQSFAHRRHAVLAAVLFAFISCSSPPGEPLGGPDPLAYDTHPETPSILRDVAMVNDDKDWSRPYVPGLRTTQDGRVGLRTQGGPDTLSFWLFTPEKLEAPLLPGDAGAQMLASPDPVQVEWPPALMVEDLQRVGHHAICDPTMEFPQEGEQTNPYPCGEGMASDCYDLVIVSSTARSFVTTMWGTPVTVEVSSPKTVDAQLERVELGEPVQGAILDTALEWAEVAVTNDGRLLSGRWGAFLREWTNPETGETFERMYDFGYSVLPPDAEPCDVTRWTEFHPMSHAPYDPALIGRYGLAEYPFRDTEGNLIADGEDMGGSYPWVDREGANVFMTGVPGTLVEQSEERYPRRCVVEGCDGDEPAIDWDRGFMIAGLWTHGKLVHLDGMINNMDWTVGVAPESHWWVELYKDADGSPREVRFGSGRGGSGTPPPPAFPGNANILDSLQNLPNFVPAAEPVTPRDVVWVMSTGVATDEIAFDDYLDPRAVILSNMQATITQLRGREGETMGIPIHHNGQTRELGRIGIPIASEIPYRLDNESDADIHIQNGATSIAFAVPSYGLVEAGTGRVEPVALGGVKGRGFWLDGTNRIRYDVPEAIAGERYIGLYVDPRTTEGATRALFTFPDRTGVRLVDRQTLQYTWRNRVLHEVALPVAESGWMHLAWQVSADGLTITLLVDGFAFERFEADRPFFEIAEGELVVGRERDGDAGVRGWIDDFKVLAHPVDPEVACNHAGGTLIDVGSAAEWAALADGHPAWAHEQVAAAAGRAGGQYACFHDYTQDYGAHLGNIPDGAESVRDAILFPEGPLMAGAPRPDSSDNAFCLSCHTAEGKAGMGLAALEHRPDVMLEDDRRRQPLQPPRRVFGNIPAGWIPPGEGPGSPAESMVAPPEGLVVDPWILPSP